MFNIRRQFFTTRINLSANLFLNGDEWKKEESMVIAKLYARFAGLKHPRY
jgi:hypothetical protein